MSKYKAEWREFDKNEEFWKEVLVGRTINEIAFDADGVSALHLDSGEIVYFPKQTGGGRFYIKDDTHESSLPASAVGLRDHASGQAPGEPDVEAPQEQQPPRR